MAKAVGVRDMQPVYADLTRLGASKATVRFFQDVATRIDKNLTNTGSIVVGTPLPNAVDANGNLLLKNVVQAAGVTAGPTTNSAAFVVIPEMSVQITPNGNKVLLIFNGTFQVDTLASLLSIAIFRDGVRLSYLNLTSWPDANAFAPSSISWLDTPVAGAQHTYDIRWNVSAGNATAVGTDRALQVVELG